MGGKALLAGLLCLTLPETKGMPTAETLEVAEDVGIPMTIRGKVGPTPTIEEDRENVTSSPANLIGDQ